jgi:hypothetical protein
VDPLSSLMLLGPHAKRLKWVKMGRGALNEA